MVKRGEEIVSMFIGLIIVIAVGWLLVNNIKRNTGKIDVPGISTTESSTDKLADKDSPEVSQDKEYVVMKGDSLWKIAQNVYGDGNQYSEIIKTNNLVNPNFLTVGQKLVLPTTKIDTVEKVEYLVAKGDSLWKISVNTYGDGYAWTKVWLSNKNVLKDPNKIEIGMKLILPKI